MFIYLVMPNLSALRDSSPYCILDPQSPKLKLSWSVPLRSPVNGQKWTLHEPLQYVVIPATVETGTKWNGAQAVYPWAIRDGFTEEVTSGC